MFLLPRERARESMWDMNFIRSKMKKKNEERNGENVQLHLVDWLSSSDWTNATFIHVYSVSSLLFIRLLWYRTWWILTQANLFQLHLIVFNVLFMFCHFCRRSKGRWHTTEAGDRLRWHDGSFDETNEVSSIMPRYRFVRFVFRLRRARSTRDTWR